MSSGMSSRRTEEAAACAFIDGVKNGLRTVDRTYGQQCIKGCGFWSEIENQGMPEEREAKVTQDDNRPAATGSTAACI